MKQPELGKKIIELRKSKGLTQEELVEKCNINVRTLQRIESGEVTPRSYTIKIIFKALDCNIYDSTTEQSARLSTSGLKGIFDFKTNKFKRFILVAFLSLVVIILILFGVIHANKPDKLKIRNQIETANHNFVRLFNSGQIDSLSNLYTDSASLILANVFPVFNRNLPSINGRVGIKSYYTLYYGQKVRFVERESKKIVIDKSIVVDIGIIELKGESNYKASGMYITQWLCVDGIWQIENEMYHFDNK